MANVEEMLFEVRQNFSSLSEKYPRIKKNLAKCYKSIEAGYSREISDQDDAKEKIKKLLMESMDMTHVETTYDDLISETASNEKDLIKLLKTLSEAIRTYTKKTTLLRARQGKLLKDAKTFLTKEMYKSVQEEIEFTTRYCNFLISLHDLLEEYPRLCYCAVPIKPFMGKIKIIKEICEEQCIYWKHVSSGV